MSEEIKNHLKEIFRDPTVAANVARIATATKPVYYSSRSNLPYYKKQYGEMMKEDIDAMIGAQQKGEPCELVYRYEVWCGKNEETIKHLTLYNRINQSIRYVVDCLDTPDKKYFQWNESVSVSRDADRQAVIVKFNNSNEEYSNPNRPRPELIEPHAQKYVWEQQLENWITSSNMHPFVKTGLLLTPEEVNNLKARFATLNNFLVEITSCEIRIVKMS